jgi:predicted nucleic acid-binding Zn ribbon protein
MSEADPEPKVPPESVRTPVVGSRRRCPVCQAVDLTGRQTACSASCRRERSRQRETAARQARDREIRALLETALRKLQEGP